MAPFTRVLLGLCVSASQMPNQSLLRTDRLLRPDRWRLALLVPESLNRKSRAWPAPVLRYDA